MINSQTCSKEVSFQAKIQGLKKTASKGDKKKKKEVTEEIAKLEADLNVKHENELKELKSQPDQKEDNVETVTNEIEQIEIKEKKVSKAQKRRDKKVEKEQQRLISVSLIDGRRSNDTVGTRLLYSLARYITMSINGDDLDICIINFHGIIIKLY